MKAAAGFGSSFQLLLAVFNSIFEIQNYGVIVSTAELPWSALVA